MAHTGIGFVARPPHESNPDGFKRAGRFKKASNMNYGLALSLKLEKCLKKLEDELTLRRSARSSRNASTASHLGQSIEYSGNFANEEDDDLEDEERLEAGSLEA